MEHLKTYNIEDPDLISMMADIHSLRKLGVKVQKQIQEKIFHRNRLESISIGKASELVESMKVIYGMSEPASGFQLQFDFKRHRVRVIETGQNSILHNPYGIAEGDEWKEDGIDESEIDWDNKDQVAEFNKKKSEEWDRIRSERNDGIDWTKIDDDDDDDEPAM